MAKQRIFIVNQGDDSQRFGVGKYIAEMIAEATRRENDYEMIVVAIGCDGISDVEIKKEKNISYLDIPKPFLNRRGSLYGLTKPLSQAVFSIIMDFFEIKANDIFHFNSNMQHFLIRKIKESTAAKIIYTVHVSMWNVLYQKNEEQFLSEWNDPKCSSVAKKNIEAEIQNCELAGSVIGLSNDTVDDLIRYYKVPTNKLKRIFNGISTVPPKIDSKKMDVVYTKLDINAGDFVFLFAGRVNKQKGISDLLEAFEGICKSGDKNLKLLVLGEGPQKDKLKEQFEAINDAVQFLGYVPQTEIHYYYKLSHSVVIPSLYDQNPYTVLEAMAYKVPMIVTDIDAFAKLEDNSVCVKVPLKNESKVDVAQLSKTMEKMVENSKLRDTLKENAHDMLTEHFSSSKMFLDTYSC